MEKIKEVKTGMGFLEEEPGVKSSMRLMSFAVFFLLVGIDFMVLRYSFYGKSGHSYDMWFVVFMIGINLIFLIACFYPKYLQKIIELGASKIGTFKNALAPIKPSDINPEAASKQVTKIEQTTTVEQ